MTSDIDTWTEAADKQNNQSHWTRFLCVSSTRVCVYSDDIIFAAIQEHMRSSILVQTPVPNLQILTRRVNPDLGMLGSADCWANKTCKPPKDLWYLSKSENLNGVCSRNLWATHTQQRSVPAVVTDSKLGAPADPVSGAAAHELGSAPGSALSWQALNLLLLL